MSFLGAVVVVAVAVAVLALFAVSFGCRLRLRVRLRRSLRLPLPALLAAINTFGCTNTTPTTPPPPLFAGFLELSHSATRDAKQLIIFLYFVFG